MKCNKNQCFLRFIYFSLLNFLSLFAFVGCDKILTKTNLGEERVYLAYKLQSIIGKPRQELETGIWRQELKVETMEKCCLMAYLHGLLSLLS